MTVVVFTGFIDVIDVEEEPMSKAEARALVNSVVSEPVEIVDVEVVKTDNGESA